MARLMPWLLHLPRRRRSFASLVLAALFLANAVDCASQASQARGCAGRFRRRAHEADTSAHARQRRSRYTNGQSSTARPRQAVIKRASTSRNRLPSQR